MPLNQIEKMVSILTSEEVNVWHYFAKREGPRFCWQPMPLPEDGDEVEKRWRWCETMEQLVEEAYAHIDPLLKPIRPVRPFEEGPLPSFSGPIFVGVDLAAPEGSVIVQAPNADQLELVPADGQPLLRSLTADDLPPGPLREKFEEDTKNNVLSDEEKVAILRDSDPQPGDDFVGGA